MTTMVAMTQTTINYRDRLITGEPEWHEDDHSRFGGGWVASVSSITIPCGKVLSDAQASRWLFRIGYPEQRHIEYLLAEAAENESRQW